MIHDHHQHVPTSIKEIARSFSDSTAARLSTVKVSAEDFHGDGSGSDVAVIRTNGLLGDSGEAALVQQRSKKSLSVILDAIRLAPGGSSEQCIESGVRTAHGGVGGSYLAGALCGHHALPLNGLALALVAQANAARAQGAPDFVAMSGVSDGESERENGFPGEVALDEISSIKVCPFEGHVYNLQTTSRLYIGNGLIVHNCRCNARILPEPPDNATPNTGDEEIDEE
jgi:hypothetical protein